jgi:hypothetical protein
MIYVIGLLVFVLAFVLPGHYYPWTSFQQEVMAAGGTALCALGVVVTSHDWPARVPAIAWAAVACAVIPLVQWQAGLMLFHSDALISALYLAAFALTIITGLQLYRMHGSRFVGLALGSALVAALVSVGIGATQWPVRPD